MSKQKGHLLWIDFITLFQGQKGVICCYQAVPLDPMSIKGHLLWIYWGFRQWPMVIFWATANSYILSLGNKQNKMTLNNFTKKIVFIPWRQPSRPSGRRWWRGSPSRASSARTPRCSNPRRPGRVCRHITKVKINCRVVPISTNYCFLRQNEGRDVLCPRKDLARPYYGICHRFPHRKCSKLLIHETIYFRISTWKEIDFFFFLSTNCNKILFSL